MYERRNSGISFQIQNISILLVGISKKLLFSSFATIKVFNCDYSHVQQTPKPLAQDPAEVPPLLVHSDLGNKIIENCAGEQRNYGTDLL